MEDQGKRILLFVVLAAAIFFAWQWFFPPEKHAPPKPNLPGQVAPASDESPAGKVGPAPTNPTAPTTNPTAPTTNPTAPIVVEEPPAKEETLTLHSEQVDVTFSSIGGVVKDWLILYDPVKGRVMNEHLYTSELAGMGLGATNFQDSTVVIPRTAAWKMEQAADQPRLVKFTYPADLKVPHAIEVVKTFEFVPDAYMLKMSVEVSVPKDASAGGKPIAEASQRLVVSLVGHAPNESSGNRRGKVPTGASCYVNGGVSTTSANSLRDHGKKEQPGTVRWIGLAHRYELVALAPKPVADEHLSCNKYPVSQLTAGVQVDLEFDEVKYKAGDPGVRREMVLYVGPKYLDKLEDADHIAGFSTHFRNVVDLGWFSIIAKPMLWILHKIYDAVGNWGIAIILLTILVKLATLYWTTKSMRSMKAMAALRPEIEAIQKKYPDDKQKQQQAQMDLFKQHNVSPLSGCLPMLLQMPIWLALYKMLSVAGELHRAVFIPGWLNDLTARDPYYIIPVTLTGLMFVQSRIQPSTGDSMQQKVLQYGLPLMFGFMGLYFPSGLGVYMLTNTMLGITHSLYMKRTDKHRKASASTPEKAADKVEKVELPRAEVVRRGEPAAEADADEDASDDSDADEGEADGEGEDVKASAAQAKTNGVRRSQRNKRRGKRR